MSEFKLIAIRPLVECDALFRKNLKEGVIYKFYQNYCFFDIDDTEIIDSHNNLSLEINSIKINSSSINLYSDESNASINISAIVGENGSGKSSLIELFLYHIYWFSIQQDLNLLNDPKDQLIQNIELLNSAEIQFDSISKNEAEILLHSTGYSSFIHYLFTLSKNHNIFPTPDSIVENKLSEEFKTQVLNSLQSKKSAVQGEINKLIELEENLRLSFYSELIFQIDDEIHIFQAKGLSFKHFSGVIENNVVARFNYINEFPDLQNFFYSNLLNYSHHALNSKSIGNWINSLFHKNDAYKCPIVINPMRSDGNFDINQEEKFAKERLLINLIHSNNQDKDFQFLGSLKNKIHRIILKISSDKTNDPVSNNPDYWSKYMDGSMTLEKQFFKSFIEPIFHNEVLQKIKKIPNSELIVEYIIKKLYRLVKTYPDYTNFPMSTSSMENYNYSLDLKRHFDKDQSHTSFKIRRALNYLKQNIEIVNHIFWKQEINKFELEFTLDDLKTACGIKKSDGILEINKKIPPSIFDIDFEFTVENNIQETNLEKKLKKYYKIDSKQPQTYRFGKLSSGEKQFVYSWQSILYHLFNLESVHEIKNNSTRQTYKNVNLILDEVELYMHPEYQRNFVNNLLTEIKSLKLEGIKSVNILFATHSPFILSDIPAQNVLKLVNGEPQDFYPNEQTFGANIHDLLANDFFLEKGFMGEFAKNWISGLIAKIEGIEDRSVDEEKYKEIQSEISIIGEPLLANSLRSMLDLKFKEIIVLNLRENELLKELENIRKEKERNNGAN